MENSSLAISQPMKTHYEEIAVALIDDPVRAMRTDMSRESIEELVVSIRQVGLIEPIVVKPVGERYEVIAGHRRITAAEAAGLDHVPCHIVEATEEQVEMMKIHENLMRVDVNPVDEAQHYHRLMQDMKLSPMRIARLTNRGEGYVRDRLQIMDYADELKASLADGRVKLTVAKELNRIKDPMKLREMLGYAVGHGITGAVAKKWVDESLPNNQPDPETVPLMGDFGNIVPASEQHSRCFYCMEEVRLMEAYTVYVHDACLAQRQSEVDAPPEEVPAV